MANLSDYSDTASFRRSVDCLLQLVFRPQNPVKKPSWMSSIQLIYPLVGSSGASKQGPFFLNILLGQVLGIIVYGIYAIGRNFIGLLKPLAHIGLDSGVVRYGAIHRSEGDDDKLLGTLYATLLVSVESSLLVGGLLYTIAGFLGEMVFAEPKLRSVLRLFAVLLPVYVMVGIVGAVSQTFKQIPYGTLITKRVS